MARNSGQSIFQWLSVASVAHPNDKGCTAGMVASARVAGSGKVWDETGAYAEKELLRTQNTAWSADSDPADEIRSREVIVLHRVETN